MVRFSSERYFGQNSSVIYAETNFHKKMNLKLLKYCSRYSSLCPISYSKFSILRQCQNIHRQLRIQNLLTVPSCHRNIPYVKPLPKKPAKAFFLRFGNRFATVVFMTIMLRRYISSFAQYFH